ncbi:MAG: transcription antitermination factor NusB [Planctomycetota bacterium]|nr:MAG: transcription antitermination factor NusB [Planctomycetota bacterium]
MSSAASPSSSRSHAAARKRRQARVYALSLAYAWDQKHHQDDDLLAVEGEPEECNDSARRAGGAIFTGLTQERPAVDAIIDQCLTNWTLGRMAVLDRSILRLGCYELLYCPNVPPKVAINEYIEIAKIYGSDGRTAKLVNGVLDRIAKDHRRPEGQ